MPQIICLFSNPQRFFSKQASNIIMCYFSGKLFHQHKFFQLSKGPHLLFPQPLVSFYLIDALVLCHLPHHIHILCIAFLKCFTTSLHMFFPYSIDTAFAWKTRSSLYRNYILSSIILQLNELSRSPQPLQLILLSIPSSLYILVL